MSIHIIIGKNFGDEGKGLAVDYYALQAEKKDCSCLVLRHNGGAQAGHTVDLTDKNFVFHQLSAGSFRQADTFWTETYMPDFYKLSEELEAFETISGIKPHIYASPKCRCVTIDDVLMNMAVETSRGTNRHGSCGMGINEAKKRSGQLEYLLSVKAVKSLTAESLANELYEIRNSYLPKMLKEYQLTLPEMGEYGELLQNKNVLINAAEEMCRAVQKVEIVEDNIVMNYDDVIFEGAQGLLLDENYISYAPHLTSSRTGLFNPITFCMRNFPKAFPKVVYVSRAYVTRHGLGPLPNEVKLSFGKSIYQDKTNIPNPWQGTIRYALHGTPEEFTKPVSEDLQEADRIQDETGEQNDISGKGVTLMITHLNETNQNIYSRGGVISTEQWFQDESVRSTFQHTLLSDTPYSKDVKINRTL